MADTIQIREKLLDAAISLSKSISTDISHETADNFGRSMLMAIKKGNSISILNNWINVYNSKCENKIEKFNENTSDVKFENKIITPGSIMTFGVHKGHPAGSIPAKYLLWADVDIDWFILDDEFREGLKIQKNRDDEADAQEKLRIK